MQTPTIEQIKAIRTELGLSQAGMAKRCQLSLKTWSNYEVGKTTIHPLMWIGIKSLVQKDQPVQMPQPSQAANFLKYSHAR